MINVWKPIAICLAAGLALSLGIQTASADRNPNPSSLPRSTGAGCGSNEPHMAAALTSLQQALADLQQAEHNKHNWRVNAIASVKTALEQTTSGCNAS